MRWREHCCSSCLKACFLLGLPDEVIQQVKDIVSATEIEQNGNDFKITTTTGPNVMVNRFTIGKETEIEGISGEKIKVGKGKTRQSVATEKSEHISGDLRSSFLFEGGVSSRGEQIEGLPERNGLGHRTGGSQHARDRKSFKC